MPSPAPYPWNASCLRPGSLEMGPERGIQMQEVGAVEEQGVGQDWAREEGSCKKVATEVSADPLGGWEE